MKRLLDLIIAILAVSLLSPVFTIIVIALKLSSKRAVVFRQERAGKNGKPFVFYKFRTMKLDTEPFGHGPVPGGRPVVV